ncbi:beta-ketoacyl synthase N-terminal-like domain-containing protein [Streptomyces sp. NPDC096013]|uniref:beta-ketoacyl synthase N-terminal-like domain-containing protein n=1 Tax=Streptomyces sp. NPDC096013 TaxID=3366069 RepID=UPI00381A4438
MPELRTRVLAQGIVAPGAADADELARLIAGGPAAGPTLIDRFPVEGGRCDRAFQTDAQLRDPARAQRAVERLAAHVGAATGCTFHVDIDPVDHATRMLFACCDQVENELGGPLPQLLGDRVGIFLGTCSAHLPSAGYMLTHAVRDADDRSVRILLGIPEYTGVLAKLYFGWEPDDPVSAHVTTTGCSASLDAIGRAAAAVASGRVTHAVAGGMDVVNEPLLRGFEALQSMTNAACRPYDTARQGFQLGEGAGLVLLGAAVPGRSGPGVSAFGTGLDGYRLTVPHPDGAGLRTALIRAVDQAGAPPGGVIGHGTAVPGNDETELGAYAAELTPDTPVTSLKSLFGHSLGAAGAHNVLAGLQALRIGALPGTRNLENPLKTPLRLSADPLPLRGPSVAVCSPAFGGNNAVLVLGTTGS